MSWKEWLYIGSAIATIANVVSYSEDGAGYGATALFIRGNDTYRTNVTINGIPYNDAESQGVFFYNLSDFASSAENIQLQRKIGTFFLLFLSYRLLIPFIWMILRQTSSEKLWGAVRDQENIYFQNL